MRRPEFSEFSFGFALTQEICARHSNTRAPVFPSLLQEGHLGYDVHLPAAAIFLQFKLSYQLRTRKAGEFNLFEEPYYRLYLHRRNHSRQHDLLLALEQTGQRVLYCAPTFHLSADLNRLYATSTIIPRTAFFRPSSIGPLPDDNQHYVVFVPANTPAFFCSKPVSVSRTDFGQELGALSALRSRTRTVRRFADELIASLSTAHMTVARQPVPTDDLFPHIADPMVRAGLVSRLLFDSELLVVGQVYTF